jgi:anti-sigma B factor antagonist
MRLCGRVRSFFCLGPVPAQPGPDVDDVARGHWVRGGGRRARSRSAAVVVSSPVGADADGGEYRGLRELTVGLDVAWPVDQEEWLMFNVELSGHGGHGVVALCGELDLADAPIVASHLIAAVAAFGPSIIVDLAGLEFIDCCGLGVLVRVQKWARESGGDMYLVGPRQRVRRVLEMAGLIGFFSVYPSVEQAVTGARLARPLSAAAS